MDLLDETAVLVAISSVTGNETALALHLRDRLSRGGREVQLHDKGVLVPPADDGRPLVVLAGHLDTVPPQGNENPRPGRRLRFGAGGPPI